MNDLEHIHEVLKTFLNYPDAFEKILHSKTHVDLAIPGVHDYVIDCGEYEGTIFFVLINQKHHNLFSIGNAETTEPYRMEFYTDNDRSYPSIFVNFPEELTVDSYFNANTVHDLHGVPLEFMVTAHDLYKKITVIVNEL